MAYVTHAVSADPINGIEAIEGLFISESQELLAKHGITHVVSLTEDRDWPMMAAESGIKHLKVPLVDIQLEDLLMYLDMVVMWIEDALRGDVDVRVAREGEESRIQQQEQQGGRVVRHGERPGRGQGNTPDPEPLPRVLVHCLQGVSRSGAVVVAYTMRAAGLDYDAALGVVRKYRPAVSPNPGFADQLRLWRQLQCRIFTNADPVTTKSEYESWRDGRGILMSKSEEARREANLDWTKGVVVALEYQRRPSMTRGQNA
ncbi:dual specificity phosphatase (phosphoserine/threonine and phosphotyrosine phosphatase) [Apiospora kogelbergensis]|uniref:protein-tyrosine-phosphatase n=1 Tax=Apiospora kogelbergensis TaxID=1337665 RepID=A0AAW0QFV0_9PEZI